MTSRSRTRRPRGLDRKATPPRAAPIFSAIPARRFTLGFSLLLALVLVAAYANSFRIDFQFDDSYVVEQNPAIRSFANIPRFFWDPFTSTTVRENVDLRPIPLITFTANYAISALAPWSWHAVSLLLHFLVAFMVFLLLRDHLAWPIATRGPEGEARVPAAAAALLFAVAPLETQAVVYMSARSAVLATLFTLLAMLAFLRRRYGWMSLFHVLGLLSKAIAITLPLLLLTYDFLYRDRERAPTIHAWLRDWRRLLAPFAMLLTIDVAYLIYRKLLLPPWLAETFKQSFVTPVIWMMSEWSAYLYYVRLFLWPDGLSIDHEFPYAMHFMEPRAIGALCVIVIWIGLSLAFARRRPQIAFATLWFFLTLAPESTIAPLAEVVNDYRPYIASTLGLAPLLVWGLQAATSPLRSSASRVFAVAVGALCLAAMPITLHRNWQWSDPLRLWVDALEKGPTHPRAWMNAGRELLARGQLAEARPYLEKARDLAPNYVYARINLSALALHEGNKKEALHEADEAVRLGPDLALPHEYRGKALEVLGRIEEAKAEQHRALEIAPDDVESQQAIARLNKRSDEPAFEMADGMRLLKSDPTAAATHFRKVLDANPDHYGATYQLAAALDLAGRHDEALPIWKRALRMAERYHDEDTTRVVRERLGHSAATGP